MKKIISLVLAVAMICSMFAIPVSAEPNEDNRIWFELNGNSRFFVEKDAGIFENRTTYTDYLPGVDFASFVAAPTGDFATDQAAVTNPGHGGCMFLYTVDKNTKGSQYAMPDFTTGEDGNLYWTINDVAYRINPDENVIKVVKNAVDTSALTDEDMIARYESLNAEAVIDVEDGRYKNVGILVGLASNYSRTAKVTLVYEDETVEENIAVTTSKLSSETSYLTGYLYLQNFTNTGSGGSSALGGTGFVPFTIETDPTKTLTEIRIKDGTTTSTANSFYVLSAWGELQTAEELIAEINAKIENATTIEELEAIDLDSIEEAYDCDLTEQRAAIANKIAEINKAEQFDDKQAYYYPIEYNRDAFFTVAEALEFGAFDASGNPWPEKDLEGNALDTTSPWFGTKGFVRLLGSVQKGASGFLIDSIKGVAGGKVTAQGYTSATNDTIKTFSKTLLINGNPNFELQSTDASGAENYIYNANGFKYKLGPIGGSAHRTADGGYNVRALLENETLKFERVQEGAQKFGMLLASKQTNEGVAYAALQKVEITYNDGKAKEAKYLVVTNMSADNESFAATTYDGDRLARLVVAVPKKDAAGVELDHTTGSVLKANAKIVSESNSEELIGKAITVEDVVFPADLVVGESVAIADLGIGRNQAITNGRRYCPEGYANHYELDFGADVEAIEYQGGIGYGKSYPGAILNSHVAYVPVEIPGASEDYLYYARFGRPCGNWATVLMGASSEAKSVEELVAELNEELNAIDVATITKEECEALRAKIEELKAAYEIVADSNFNTTLLAEAEARIKAELTESYRSLKIKSNFKMTEANGANAKLFIDYDTYQTYKANQAVSEEWVPGLDFAGIVKAEADKPYTSYPTGTDADVISGYSNALIFKVDQAPVANPVKYNVPFVNLTTKNGELTWTVNGTDFAINPYGKVVKVYTPTDASGVADAALRARFESLNNPVLDIEDGAYETITILAGTTGTRTLTPTVIYKDGTSKKLSGIVTAGNKYEEGESQDTGFQYLQALTNWANLNSSGAAKFAAITLTGYDTSKVIDKISFTSDAWGTPIFVLSAFGETATIEEALNTADITSSESVLNAIDIVDVILAENNITVNDLPVDLIAKYNELKKITVALEIEKANKALEAITEDSSFEEIVAAKELYEKTAAIEGVEETDFDETLVEKMYELYEAGREKAEVKGALTVEYAGNTVTVDVEITNLAEKEGKKYAVLLTYINEKGFVVGSKVFTGESTIAKEETVNFTDDAAPSDAVKVKAYIWKAIGSLKPLGKTITETK